MILLLLMTANDIEDAFEKAATDFNTFLVSLRPLRSDDEGYCEANLVEYYSNALRQKGFKPFLELPIENKCRVDGLFLRDSTVLLVEAKQFHKKSILSIDSDLKRRTPIDLDARLRSYGFAARIKERFDIALCDRWTKQEKDLWMEKSPFLCGYTKAEFPVPPGQIGYPRHSYN